MPHVPSGMRAACAFAAAAGLLGTVPAWSQPQPQPQPQGANNPAAPPAPVAQVAPAAATGYVDQVLDEGPQKDQEEEQSGYNTAGWPRSLRLEYSLASLSGAATSRDQALAFSGFVDTPDWGALSLNGAFTQSHLDAVGAGSQPNRFTWRADQRAMPFSGGWLADHQAGDISTLAPPLARGVGRLFLPTSPVYGVGGHWYRADTLDVNLVAGRLGLYSGLDVNGFQSQPGKIVSGGAQMRFTIPGVPGNWAGAAQVSEAQGVEEGGVPGGLKIGSAWSTLAWEGRAPWADKVEGLAAQPMASRVGGLRVQGNLIQSTTDPGQSAQGEWLDAGWRTESLQNLAGVYRFDPNVRWGPTVFASDLEGAYWRADMFSRQWQLGWSVETDRSVTGAGASSSFANVNARYRLDTRNTFGTTIAMRQGSGEGKSVQVTWDRRSLFGQLQLRASALRTQLSTTTALGLDHAFNLTIPNSLAVSLGWSQTQFASGGALDGWTWGVLANYFPWPGLSFSGNLRGAHAVTGDSLNLAVGATWEFMHNWSLVLRYSQSRGIDPGSLQVVSALTEALQAATQPAPPTRSIQMLLRYEEHAGTAYAPIGGLPGAGAGRLAGTVFFDTNDNGRRDASEGGAPNIVVVLDGRYVTRTDAQGLFEFAAVVAGDHKLQVQADNVPLPWSPANQDAVPALVTVRGSTTVDFPLRREP